MPPMIPRLHIDAPLAPGATAVLGAEQAHYLRNVLRCEVGATIHLFNVRDGEFASTIVEVAKKRGLVVIGARVRAPSRDVDITILFANVKRAATEMIIQKSTELGAAAFVPVLTERTNAQRLRTDRLAAIAREAAEQCGRLSVPDVAEPRRLETLLADWNPVRRLIHCDEAGDNPAEEWGGATGRAAPMLEAIAGDNIAGDAILIGPEGGFSECERARLRRCPFVLPVTLGPRILRADTAAIAALALWQAACGDWRNR